MRKKEGYIFNLAMREYDCVDRRKDSIVSKYVLYSYHIRYNIFISITLDNEKMEEYGFDAVYFTRSWKYLSCY